MDKNTEFENLLKSNEKNRTKKRYFPDFWIRRKYKETQALNLAFKHFTKTVSEEEKEMISVCSAWDKRFYIIRGFSETEAKEIVYKAQSKNFARRKEKYKDKKLLLPVHLEYYLNQGMSHEEAKTTLKSRQSTFSLASNIKKYGNVEGLKRWENRQIKWQKTMLQQSPEELARIKNIQKMSVKDWALKKCSGNFLAAEKLAKAVIDSRRVGNMQWALKKANGDIFLAKKIFLDRLEKIFKNGYNRSGNVSKESVKAFEPLVKYVNEKYKTLIINTGCNELLIRTDESLFKYDFALPEIKILIEYHGTAWHPKQNDTHWKSPFGMTYHEAHAKDLLKKKIAENAGFLFFEIWSDEQIDYEFFKKVIDEKYKSYTENPV